MTDRSRDSTGQIAALLLGVAAFFVFAGWWVLLPTNLSWLGGGDRAMHTLGWLFYRDAPWGFPPGQNRPLGLEIGNSIALVDGLPLLAMPLKLLSAWLPRPFQYWGYWWLITFALQSLFAYRIARELDATRLVALCAALFALITPAFLARLPIHLALASHFLLLAALWLYVRREPPAWWRWPLLIALTAAVHIYLLAMVCAVWLVAWLQRLWLRRVGWRLAIGEPVLILVLTSAVLFLAGAFDVVGATGAEGFGFFRLNLLGPVLDYGMWSKLVPSLPHGEYDYEALSFLGIGILAALLLALVTGALAKLRDLFTPRFVPLVIVTLLCVLFAISNRIGVADLSTRPIPLPHWLQALGAAFRSSGRFVWPALYLVTIGTVVVLGARLRAGIVVPVLIILAAAQIYDSRVGWQSFRATIPDPAPIWQFNLSSPVWDRAAAAGYNRLRAIFPVYPRNRDWKALETYAATHNMGTDVAYLGRVDEKAVAALQMHDEDVLDKGWFEPKTLYILDLNAARRAAAQVMPADLFAVIDNRIVFAKGGAALVDGLNIDVHGAMKARSWLNSGN